jgi:hypothetical protein
MMTQSSATPVPAEQAPAPAPTPAKPPVQQKAQPSRLPPWSLSDAEKNKYIRVRKAVKPLEAPYSETWKRLHTDNLSVFIKNAASQRTIVYVIVEGERIVDGIVVAESYYVAVPKLMQRFRTDPAVPSDVRSAFVEFTKTYESSPATSPPPTAVPPPPGKTDTAPAPPDAAVGKQPATTAAQPNAPKTASGTSAPAPAKESGASSLKGPEKKETQAKPAPEKKETQAKKAPEKKETQAKQAPEKKETQVKKAPEKKKEETQAKQAPEKKETQAKKAPEKKEAQQAKKAPEKKEVQASPSLEKKEPQDKKAPEKKKTAPGSDAPEQGRKKDAGAANPQTPPPKAQQQKAEAPSTPVKGVAAKEQRTTPPATPLSKRAREQTDLGDRAASSQGKRPASGSAPSDAGVTAGPAKRAALGASNVAPARVPDDRHAAAVLPKARPLPPGQKQTTIECAGRPPAAVDAGKSQQRAGLALAKQAGPDAAELGTPPANERSNAKRVVASNHAGPSKEQKTPTRPARLHVTKLFAPSNAIDKMRVSRGTTIGAKERADIAAMRRGRFLHTFVMEAAEVYSTLNTDYAAYVDGVLAPNSVPTGVYLAEQR